jgi:hypothetical protein
VIVKLVRTGVGVTFAANVVLSFINVARLSLLPLPSSETVLWFINAGIWMLVLLAWIRYTEDA